LYIHGSFIIDIKCIVELKYYPMKTFVQQVVDSYNKDHTRLMDILHDIQERFGYIPAEYNQSIADQLGISRVDLEQTITFYHFFTQRPLGKYTVYLNDSAVANMMGRDAVRKTFEEEAGIKFGHVAGNGLIGLFDTACIGMNDQEPSAIINGMIFNNLTPYRVKEIVNDMHDGKPVGEMYKQNYGDGNNSSERVRTVVSNNIRRKGPVLWEPYSPGEGVKKAAGLTPAEVINEIKQSNLRGRGGAGFPTGLKWEFCSKSLEKERYVFCNADEGEPGTFKDRVVLTELPMMVFEGMAIAGYSIGARQGILYLRYEYLYLKKHLEHVLDDMRKAHLLGSNIAGNKQFDFDIRIQFGAGAYVCGEESALIESAEGKRGEPRDRPPFPVEKGYLEKPTVINNVETLATVVKILKNGAEWFKSFGTATSAGTKLLSISGDCRFPGVYEVEWGHTIYDVLHMVSANDTQAVQVGGPSGTLISPNEFMRKLGYEDMATGGSIIVINKSRNILRDIVLNFMNFFIDESCGSCSICRNMPTLLRDKLVKILDGHGVMQDIADLESWSKLMKYNRCGLGQTAANPIITSLRSFRNIYEILVQKDREFDTGFNLAEAVRESSEAAGRTPIL
jgi:[NiFe] hydrogenase diaphorase moiety large subunit